jgi:hypothetical protein
MISEPPEYDPVTIWQSQAPQSVPSLEDVLMRSRRFQTQNRRHALIFSIALGLHLFVSIAEDLAGTKSTIWWVGAIRFLLMTIWVYFLPFNTARNDQSSTLFLREAATTPVLDFYKRQLQKQRDYFQDNFVRKLQIVFLIVSFILYSIFYPPVFLFFGFPFAIVVAVFFKRRQRQLPRLQEELETLARYLKEENGTRYTS